MRTSFRLPLPLCLLLLSSCGDGGTSPPGGGPDSPADRIRGYIRKSPYPKLVFEIDTMPSFEPRASSENGLAQGLGGVIDKPGGITVTHDRTLASKGADHAWTFAELDALAKSTFDLAVPADTIKMHVLFIDGHYSEDSSQGKVLGIAWAQTHLVMFKQTIETTCANAGLPLLKEKLCAAAELSIWTHETGHLLGLVDNGLAMVQPHRDADQAHGRHDSSDQCVMYWAYEGEKIVDLLKTRFGGGNENALGFDAACLADIGALKNAP